MSPDTEIDTDIWLRVQTDTDIKLRGQTDTDISVLADTTINVSGYQRNTTLNITSSQC